MSGFLSSQLVKATVAISLSLSCCLTVLADQITLKNGDRVSGTIVRADDKQLVFKSDLLGEVTIAIANIVQLQTDQPYYVGLEDGRTIKGTLSAGNSQLAVKTTAGQSTIEATSVKFIRSEGEQRIYESQLNPGWTEQWTGNADFGLALTKGNSDTTNIALGMAMSRETHNDKTSVYAASIYNRDGSSGTSRTVANTIRFGVRYDHDFSKKWFVYGFTDLERNGLQQLNLRWVPGGGLGYHAIRNDQTKLDLLGGLTMNREYFKGLDNDRTSLEAQIGQTLSHQLSARVSLKEQLFFFPNLSRGGEYRINFDTSLATEITKRIGWQLTVSDRYLSDPLPGFKQNDLLLTTGIRVKLGTLK